MSKTKQEVSYGKTLREELATTIVEQARTDPKILDELASDIADVLEDGDDKNDQGIASQILDMKIQDKEFMQRLIRKVLEEYKD